MLIGRQAIVVGAGIGGLAAALSLAQRGASVTVLEQAPALAEAGAGIQISPNGTAVLEALGLGAALGGIGQPLAALRMRDFARGRDILRMNVATAKYRHPWLLAHRADLLAALESAARAAGVRIETGAVVAGLVGGGRTGVSLEDGREFRAGVVIAADGARSRLRPLIDPAPDPAFRRQVAWRALLPAAPGAAPEVQLIVGPGRHLVRYPLRGGRLVNFVAVLERPDWAAETWQQQDDPAHLQAAFARFPEEITAELARLETAHLWGLFRRPAARRWVQGRVALLGDAAHATLPFLAQGAVMALEDAWVLGESLAGSDGVEAGLALYEARRRARCRRIVAAADRNALAYHLALPGLRQAAHAGLRLGERLRPGLALSQFDWLYRHDVTRS
ncbi:FAD-dependent oxidoreductase [Mangrovicoccus algicola]|uniref:FAD-dependent monooxygenase n=1 Tax=Mangrovicoccus algicola TaxID=2771008 RepID=A0A8J6YY32_9RHOB|nr:FAD-dependent oxidoreductase [Mangrovicoccus algicola]MBE3639760.1 FAD-dependent monooxygenase [Mangrovicoccus algicola]